MNLPAFTFDGSTRVRTSNATNVSDLKTLYTDNTFLWETVGTGSGAFFSTENYYNMEVTAGQYLIRRSKQYFQYYAGNSQSVELTFDNFQLESGVTKRAGYFSSNAVAPYDSNKDGFWIENDGEDYYLVVSKNGTEKLRVSISEWNQDVNLDWRKINEGWKNFNVVQFDYLWLGGAVLKLFVKIGQEFVLAYQYDYPGLEPGVLFLSPNQNVRLEIRSTGGAGELNSICQRVATEGQVEDAGIAQSINTGSTLVSAAAIGTTYPILAVRKLSTRRMIVTRVQTIDAFVGSNNDQVLVTLQINPTLSAPLSYAQVQSSSMESAKGNGTITVTTPGKIQYSKYISTSVAFPANNIESDFLNNIGLSIANISDQYVICATPVTAGVTIGAAFSTKEF